MSDNIEDDDVALDMLWIDRDCWNLLKFSGQALRIIVVVLQSSDMVIERIDAGRGEDAGLPHGAAVHAAKPSRFVDQRGIIRKEQRAGGCSQPFREADGHGFKVLRVSRRRQGRRSDSVEQPRTVQMHGDTVGGRHSTDAFDCRQRIDGPAAGIVRVLEADERGLNAVLVFGTDCGFDVFGPHEATIPGHPM